MKKIPTLFERVFENHSIKSVLPNITPGCEDALNNGIATIKLDGSCCAIINGQFYKRYDAKGKTIPNNAIPCQDEPDPITNHYPCWVPCDRNNPSDKWFWTGYDNAINSGEVMKDGTYEALGPHFQTNPYNLEKDIIEPHGLRVVEVGRTFEDIKQYLEDYYIEGLVFWLDGEPVCKIKRSDFGFPWKTNKIR